MARTLLMAAVALTLTPSIDAADPPNVLIIMADDCTHSDLGLYGGRNAITPNLDALAAQGLTFNKAYLASAMCQPCRAELFTGQYPMRNGCAWNHSASRSSTLSMPQRLKSFGYRVGIAGKIHVKPDSVFPFEKVEGFERGCVRDPTREHKMRGVTDFMTKAASPFCLVVALVEPHVPWVMGDASKYPPTSLILPPNMADTELTRDAFSRYLAEITYMDSQVGDLLASLEKTGKAEDTLVLFTSEQGSQFPGCKWTTWDTGLHTALVARWPGKVPSGKRTDALVQYSDVVPTLVDLAGGDPNTAEFDGTSFKPVLLAESKDSQRKFAYGMHNNLPEGPAYPTRTVTDGEYRYIRNLTPQEIYIEKHLMGLKGNGKLNNPYWSTWTWATQTDPNAYQLVKRYMHRPPEQLYHTKSDPYEMTNIIDQPEHAERLKSLRNELDRWMKAQGDPGVPQDTMESLEAARKGQHRFTPQD